LAGVSLFTLASVACGPAMDRYLKAIASSLTNNLVCGMNLSGHCCVAVEEPAIHRGDPVMNHEGIV